MKKLIIFGLGDLARMAYFYFTNDSSFQVAAFTISSSYIDEDGFMGLPVCAFENIEERFPPEEYDMFIAVGYSKVNKTRADFFYEAKAKRYSLATYISSKATVWSKDIGENTFIFENNTVQPFVTIGNNVIIWSGNHIGHDSIIHDHVFISSHVVLSGRTEVGEYSFLGVNATIKDRVKIARECVIGMGAVVSKNTQEKGVYVAKSADLAKLSSDKIRGI